MLRLRFIRPKVERVNLGNYDTKKFRVLKKITPKVSHQLKMGFSKLGLGF